MGRTRCRRIRSGMISSLTVVAVAGGVGAANASAATFNFDVPFNAAVTNPCTGEEIVMNGTAHNKVTTNTSLAGDIKYQIEMNLTGVQGTTLTGVRYVMNDQFSDMQHADADDAQMTLEQSFTLNRQGDTGALPTALGDDPYFRAISHLTVTNNMPKASKFEVRGDCR